MYSRQAILDAIRRTAKENENKPLGQKAFKTKTGITPFDCSRYWARFSDAIQEAGFSPNKAWTRFPDEELVQKSIEKIRKYGRYPTLSELFVEFNNGDDFPFHIFKKRSQPYMVQKILEYCQNNNGYEDVIAACAPILEKLSTHDEAIDVNFDKRIGEVYLIKSGRYFKIGKSFDTVRRGNEIRIQLPEKMTLKHSILTVDPGGIEAYWHKRFESKRMNGEWFNLTPADVQEFKHWKKIV